MEPPSASLFPAFTGTAATSAGSAAGLDWLSNRSFRTEDALQLHQRMVGIAADSPQGSPQASTYSDRDASGTLSPRLVVSGEEHPAAKKKKKKKKHHRHKKEKKKSRERDHSSGNSDPELLWEKGKQPSTVRNDVCADLPAGEFMWLDDIQSLSGQSFCIDRKADPANWMYKSLYRGDLARYKRKGDVCIGLNPKKQQILWEGPKQQKKKRAKRREDRYYSTSSLQQLRIDAVAVRCEDASQGNTPAVAPAFIPVPDWEESESRSSGPVSWVNPLGIYDASTSLWLQGKGRPEQEDKGRVPTDSGEEVNAAMLAKVERFNRLLREDSSNVQTWMEFVHFQDELMQGPNPFTAATGESEKRKRSRRMVLEKKLAILERGIESNPSRVELKVARLQLCQEAWEPSSLVNEWKKVVFLHPNDTALWQRYLLFCQSQFSTYSTSKVNGTYSKCLSTLAAALDGTLVSHPTLPGTEEAMLAIFLQQCHFLRQAGHSEKAIALFQALIDFTFFKPDSVAGLTTKAQVEFFEPFWDSGEPRFGEAGARGWKAWMRQQEKGGWIILNEEGEDEEEDEDGEEIKDKSRPKWQLWMQVEGARDAKHWLPWRAKKVKGQAEEDCEDPDRQVLFDDIGDSMFRICSPGLKFQLLSCFLRFLGVPAGSELPPSCLNLALDEPALLASGSEGAMLADGSGPSAGGVAAVGLLDAGPRLGTGHCRAGEEFIRFVFQQALPHLSGEEQSELALSWLLYEKSKVVQNLRLGSKRVKPQGKRSKRLAKRLLKEPANRNSLALWREFAHLEWLLGNVDESRRVFHTAVSSDAAQGLSSSSLCRLCLLYASLELEVVGHAACPRALHVLTRLAQGDGRPFAGDVPAVDVLKARRSYEQAARSLPADPNHLASLAGCYALFLYLTAGLQAADTLYQQAADWLDVLPLPAESAPAASSHVSASRRLATMHVALLWFHARAGPRPRRPLVDALQAALRRFPGSPRLWRLFVRLASTAPHSGSTARRFFHSLTRANRGDILPWLFAIHAEEQRKQRIDSVLRAGAGMEHSMVPETGLDNRIAALFEHAVGSEAGAHCVLLWRMFLRFTAARGDVGRTRGVFYRALQHCPWAKVLYLDAVRLLPERLQEITDLMTEKEIRLRLPLEELDILVED
ncbi:nuclear exosome regulator NRDE2 [Leucoraja erinacea]|uniref:nuclear exosome regulator NRDE2 n=1 Tax=Leucoraja erinaceus TaxID=7782 RepID=UPI002457E1B1|nr:nuclear exosome regulator NRDE2 [Leucoraja erinacea]